MEKTLDTRIYKVTVYHKQALVTRRGIVQLTGQEQELVIAQLPVTLVSESVRVSVSGTAAVSLVGVRTQRNQATESFVQDIAPLSQKIEQIEEQRRHLQNLLVLLNLQRNFVKGLSNQYLERWIRSQHPESTDLNQIRELLDFVGQQYIEFSEALVEREKEQEQLDKQLQILRQRLQELATPRTSESFSIFVSLAPSAAGKFELEVSYLVTGASWVPLYDLRLHPSRNKINLSYLAQVRQNSGEDWSDVTLTLATAKPELGKKLPKLPLWYIDVQEPSWSEKKTNSSTVYDSLVSSNYSNTMPFAGMAFTQETLTEEDLERLKAEAAMAKICQQGGILCFEVSSLCHIPSDNASHQTTIFQEDYPCQTEYIALPQLVNFAYLQVTLNNPLAGVTLLPGKANIFCDNTFVGTTQLEKIAPGQELKTNLGLDEGLKIDRELVERWVDQKLYAYRLMVKNLSQHTIQLQLIEQLPVSRHEQVKVSLTDCRPRIETNEKGMLQWSLTLDSNSQQELYYQFKVEHPAELNVVGMDI
ncbi:mucoidy inhibitor MuiA family protein [Lyngbya aestuarii]|uniref:mucoidy inhibitor MuiA family protein n=1 Tax=Lyngbya aestuarii TaxID=118322 RepID=UPI00403DE4A6